MKEKNTLLLPAALAALSETLFRCSTQENTEFTAREAAAGAVFAFGITAALLILCSACRCQLEQLTTTSVGKSGLLVLLWLCAGICIFQILKVYRQQFLGTGIWPVVLGLLFLRLRPAPQALARISCALLAICALLGVWLLAGIVPMLRWQNLSTRPINAGKAAESFFRALTPLPEYMLLPLWGRLHKNQAAGLAAVSAAGFWPFIFFTEMIFGYREAEGCYPVMEGIRCWEFGRFSSADSLAIAFWLALTYLRLLLIGTMLQEISQGRNNGAGNRHEA